MKSHMSTMHLRRRHVILFSLGIRDCWTFLAEIKNITTFTTSKMIQIYKDIMNA